MLNSDYSRLGVGSILPFKDIPDGLFGAGIINGGFSIVKRFNDFTSFTAATNPANNDDTYLFDRWILLSDGNDIVDVSQGTDVPDGGGCVFSCKSIVQTANKKFGYFQPLESVNARAFKNKTVSGSFYAKTTAAKIINNIRCAMVSWSSTADSITSDIVSAWGASGTNPTLAANWTYENTPVNIPITAAWQQFEFTASIDTVGMTNLGFFIWIDDTDAAINDELFITGVSFNSGPIAVSYNPRQFTAEERLCSRYFSVQRQRDNTYAANAFLGQAYTGAQAVIPNFFPTEMRIKPSFTIRDVGDFSITDVALNLITVTVIEDLTFGLHNTPFCYFLNVSVAAGLVAGAATMFLFNNTNASAFIRFDAEL